MELFKDSKSNLARLLPQRDKYATIGLMLFLLIVGVILVIKMNLYKNTIKCDKAQTTISTLRVFGWILVIAPLLLILLNLTGYNQLISAIAPLENVLRVQIVVFAIALVILVLTIVLNTQLGTCNNQSVDDTVWGTVIALLIGTGGFMAFRFYADYKEAEKIKNMYTLTGIVKGSVSGLKNFGSGLSNAIGISSLSLPSAEATGRALGRGITYPVRSAGSFLGFSK